MKGKYGRFILNASTVNILALLTDHGPSTIKSIQDWVNICVWNVHMTFWTNWTDRSLLRLWNGKFKKNFQRICVPSKKPWPNWQQPKERRKTTIHLLWGTRMILLHHHTWPETRWRMPSFEERRNKLRNRLIRLQIKRTKVHNNSYSIQFLLGVVTVGNVPKQWQNTWNDIK